MWLPTPIYESLPTAYIVAGMLLVVGALYVGPAVPLYLPYVSIGILCIASGFAVSARRKQTRGLSPDARNDEPTE